MDYGFSIDDIIPPEDNTYDRYGRGASPKTAVILEALANSFGIDKNLVNKLKKENTYFLSPDFIEKDYAGSGRYNTSGAYQNMIFLNVMKRLSELMGETYPHENRHKEAGAMGGVTWGNVVNSSLINNLDKHIKRYETKDMEYRLPQERMAYGGDRVLLAPHKYYLKGDLQRGRNKR